MKVNVNERKSVKENDNYSYITDLSMSNFDHSIDNGLDERLRAGNLYADYAGRDFHGTVYWNKQEDKFICEIWQYGSWTGTVKADSLQEIMDEACDRYGSG